MEHSESITDLAAALVDAQKEITGATKDKTNPHFKSKYADLSSVAEACKAPLNKYGIAFIQSAEPSEPGTLRLTTSLIHKSGQWMAGTCTMPVQQNTPQAYGSALTYARRYGLASMVGVCPEDDDGEGAEGRGNQPQRQAPRQSAQPNPDEQWVIQVNELLESRGFKQAESTRAKLAACRSKKVNNIIQLTPDDREAFIAAINDGKFDQMKGAKTTGAK